MDVLDNAEVVKGLSEAVSGCAWVAGTSARLRTIEWPILEPRACVQKGIENSEQGDIAIVFGRENNGLTNDEMEKCNALLHIPTNPEYSSLNVAAAVQVVCYEFRQAVLSDEQVTAKGSKHRADTLADSDQLEGLYQHLHDALESLGFFGTNNPEVMMRRLKSLFNRAETTQREVSIFRGICSAIQEKKRPR
jgi:tRNA (cytidine32/uridine32-2'-O)-methyltransferase